jgi:hypothetical protein
MNVDANRLGGKVSVHQVGLADRRGEATAHLDGVDVTFPVERLDRISRGRIVVLKADVEGMEALVLRGATRILRRHRPVVFAEAFTEVERSAVEAVLAPFGYRPTGRVFNATPTYEFVAPPNVRRLRRQLRRLPKPVRKVLVEVRDGLAGLR